MGRFNKGLFFGGALGAMFMWLKGTPKGKEMRTKLAIHLDPLYKEIRISLKKLEGPTKEMYEALVERAVAEYAAKKEVAEEYKDHLVHQLKKKWKDLEKDLKK